MDYLRLILLLIGVVVIAGVYAWGRFQGERKLPNRRAAASALRQQADDDTPGDALIERELERMQQTMSDQSAVAAPAAAIEMEELVVISVIAAAGEVFPGEALARAFANNKLCYGDKAIFHRILRQAGSDVSVFGVANLYKPGDFGNGDLDGFETAGITLFLELPAPIDGLQAFDDFVHTAERLAVELGGQLHDHKRCVVTHQALMQKREVLARSRLRVPLPA